MALVLEDGTGIAGADAYEDASFVTTYASNYGKSGWDTLDPTVMEQKIRSATQFLDNIYLNNFRPLTPVQRLAFPAVGARVRGVAVSGVPIQVKEAMAELAIISVKNDLSEVQATRNAIQKTSKVGDVSKSETFSNSHYQKVFHPVEMILRPLAPDVSFTGGGVSIGKLVRA